MNEHPVICSWCEREGFKYIIRWVDYPGSHGMCLAHYLIERCWRGFGEVHSMVNQMWASLKGE